MATLLLKGCIYLFITTPFSCFKKDSTAFSFFFFFFYKLLVTYQQTHPACEQKQAALAIRLHQQHPTEFI